MEDTIYIIMSTSGCKRMSKKPPKLAGDERSVAISIKVDDEIFDYTFMKSELVIKEDDVITPSLEVEVLHAHEKL